MPCCPAKARSSTRASGPPSSTPEANRQQTEYWNAAHHWVSDQAGHDEMLGPLGRLAHEALAPRPGERILDVGCGTGATTLAIAADVGSDGAVVGVDVSGLLLSVARERAPGAGSVSFVEADAQTHAFDERFDGAFSRFGVMFFEDPVSAFANVGSAVRPGGRLAFVCWQDATRNEWWHGLARVAARHQVEMPAPDAGPNPFAFADPERVRSILDDSGWSEVRLDDVERKILVGGRAPSVDAAVGFMRRSRLGQSVLAATPDEAAAEAVFDDIGRELAPYLTTNGVEMTAAVWVVAARRP